MWIKRTVCPSDHRLPVTTPSRHHRLSPHNPDSICLNSPPPLSRLPVRSFLCTCRVNGTCMKATDIMYIGSTKVVAIFMNTTRPPLPPPESHKIVQNINVHKFIYCLGSNCGRTRIIIGSPGGYQCLNIK